MKVKTINKFQDASINDRVINEVVVRFDNLSRITFTISQWDALEEHLIKPKKEPTKQNLVASVKGEDLRFVLEGAEDRKKEHTESYQLKRAADAAEKIADKVGGIDFGAVSTKLAFPDGRVIEIPSAPSQEDFDKLVKLVEALEPKCTTMDEYIKRTQG